MTEPLDAIKNGLSLLLGDFTAVHVVSDGLWVAALRFDDPDDIPGLALTTIGLCNVAAPAAANHLVAEIYVQANGDYSPAEEAAAAAALGQWAKKLVETDGITIMATPPWQFPLFPRFPRAYLTDFMVHGPDEIAGLKTRVRLVFARPIAANEVSWVRLCDQSQVAKQFAARDIQFEDPNRLDVLPPKWDTPPMSQAKNVSITDIWQQLDGWYSTHAPRMVSDLRGPATDAQIADAEAKIGRELPDELRESLRVHNGRAYLRSFEIQPAKRVADIYKSNAEKTGVKSTHRTIGLVKQVVWNAAWIPFAEDSGGDLLCVDLDPGEKGVSGQVILWGRNAQGADATEFKSYGEWLARYRDDVLAGKLIVDKDGLVVEA